MFSFVTEKYICECGREYTHRSGLSRHKKTCCYCVNGELAPCEQIKDSARKKMVTSEYTCQSCDYFTSRKGDFTKHKITRSHKLKMLPTLTSSGNPRVKGQHFVCECGKQYIYETCLRTHKGICHVALSVYGEDIDAEGNEVVLLQEESRTSEIMALKRIVEAQNVVIRRQGNVIQEGNAVIQRTTNVIERNSDTQERLAKSLDNLATRDSMKVEGDNNRVNINKINIQVFLKEQCKDALNLEDFVNSLQIHVGDLEHTREKSLEDSVRQVFMKGLKQLEVNQRPIHCTDVKRETMYIKNNDSWNKQSSGERDTIRNAVKNVANRQRTMIKEWEAKHPGWDKSERGTHEYLMLVRNVMSDIDADSKEENRIIKSIAKEVAI